jgi:hypothetical protein
VQRCLHAPSPVPKLIESFTDRNANHRLFNLHRHASVVSAFSFRQPHAIPDESAVSGWPPSRRVVGLNLPRTFRQELWQASASAGSLVALHAHGN